MKLNTVNIIEFHDRNLLAVTSFSDDKNGNKEAESFFRAILRENSIDDAEEIESALDDGYYSYQNNEYYLVHSN